jgi:hypothetical protein
MVLSENESEQLDTSHPALKLLNHIRWCDVIYQPKTIVERRTVLYKIKIYSYTDSISRASSEQTQKEYGLVQPTRLHKVWSM